MGKEGKREGKEGKKKREGKGKEGKEKGEEGRERGKWGAAGVPYMLNGDGCNAYEYADTHCKGNVTVPKKKAQKQFAPCSADPSTLGKSGKSTGAEPPELGTIETRGGYPE